MGIKAGMLTEIIVIEQECYTEDGFGAKKSTWKPVKTIRANRKFQSGTIKEDHSEMINDYRITFTVRSYHNIDDQKSRIRYRDKTYRILSINYERLQQTTTIETEYWNE